MKQNLASNACPPRWLTLPRELHINPIIVLDLAWTLIQLVVVRGRQGTLQGPGLPSVIIRRQGACWDYKRSARDPFLLSTLLSFYSYSPSSMSFNTVNYTSNSYVIKPHAIVIQTTSTSNHSTKKSKSLRPPPNTPLESTFPAFSNPFKSTLPTFFEPPSYDEDDTEADVPYTLTAYGTLAPSESYAPIPIPPPTSTYKSTLSSSPKRTANGCLQLRTPIRRPALPTRNTFSGFSGSAGYCRVVIGCAVR